MRKGRFIAIEGIDRTGKETKAKLLVKRLQKAGRQTAYFDFPRYNKRSAAFIEDYLAGEFGEATTFNPRIASLFFALDRFAAAQDIKQALAAGKIAISNRFSASSLAHQAAKFRTLKEKKLFWKWLKDFEFNFLDLPKPNITFIVMIPLEVSLALGSKVKKAKFVSSSGKKATNDQHERNRLHQKKAWENYLLLAKYYPKEYRLINCFDRERNTILPIQVIHQKIWQEVRKFI